MYSSTIMNEFSHLTFHTSTTGSSYMYGVAEITGQVLVRVNRRSELELELELEFTACLNLDLVRPLTPLATRPRTRTPPRRSLLLGICTERSAYDTRYGFHMPTKATGCAFRPLGTAPRTCAKTATNGALLRICPNRVCRGCAPRTLAAKAMLGKAGPQRLSFQ